MKLTVKDVVLAFFAISFLVCLIIILTRKDGKELLLRNEIELRKKSIEFLIIENDSLEKVSQEAFHLVGEFNKKIDSLKFVLENREPKIKYIIKKIKDENQKPIIVPADNELDSVFTSILRNR